MEKLRIADIGNVITGKTPSLKNPEHFGDEYPFITPTDMNTGRMVQPKRKISEKGYSKFYRQIIPPKSICFVCIGATIGKICMTVEDSLTNQQINSIVVDFTQHDPYFVYYMLSTYSEKIKCVASGAATPIVNKTTFENIQVTVPPLTTQKKIVSILSAYDDLIENNLRRIKILEEIAQNLYKACFTYPFEGLKYLMQSTPPSPQPSLSCAPSPQPSPTGRGSEQRGKEGNTSAASFDSHPSPTGRREGDEGRVKLDNSSLGPIPEGWEVKNLGEIALNYDRSRKPLSSMQRAERKGIYPYYGAAKILDYIDDYIFDGIYLLVAEDGSVVTKSRKPVLQYVSGKFWANNHTHILQGKDSISTEYLFLALSELDISGYITGAAQPKITQANLNRIPIIVPEHKILQIFNEFISAVFREKIILSNKNQILRKTRDLLLPKLISGELDVSELDITIHEEAEV